MAKKWPKMVKIEVLLVEHPITQPTGQDRTIGSPKIETFSDPPPFKHTVLLV